MWPKCGKIQVKCGKIQAAGDRELGARTTRKVKNGHFTPKLYDLYVFQKLNFSNQYFKKPYNRTTGTTVQGPRGNLKVVFML